MEIGISLLLILVLCALIVLILQLKNQQTNSLQMMMKSQESATHTQDISHQFDHILQQIQNLRSEQSVSFQTMDAMDARLDSINRIMTNTKARGNWGEYQLESLLEMYAGSNPEIYTMQYSLQNGKIADAILHLPDTPKVLCIDSKFPMENYISKQDHLFVRDMKKHIDDIADKYITYETVDQAILFLPSEAIYQFICAKQVDVLNYALQKHVLLTSPTTLIGVIYTLLASTRDFYRASHMEEIESTILSLQEDVKRLCLRSEKAEKTMDTLQKQFHEVSISAHKVAGRMERMANGKNDEL